MSDIKYKDTGSYGYVNSSSKDIYILTINVGPDQIHVAVQIAPVDCRQWTVDSRPVSYTHLTLPTKA